MWLTARARSGTLPVSLVLLVLLAVVPTLPISSRALYVMSIAVIYAVAAVALDLFAGYAGQLSFGHFAFVGIGAYGMAILEVEGGWNWAAAAAGALVLCAVIAAVVGVAMVRLRHFGAALTTFFFAYVVLTALAGPFFARWTHSENGHPVPHLTIAGLDVTQGWPLYYAAWIVLLVVVLLTDRYANSRSGKELRLIKQSEMVASVLGVYPRRAKLAAFIYSAVAAGAAGLVLAQSLGYLAPETFDATQSVNLLAMAVVGGLGSIAGPILGALFFTLIPEFTRSAGTTRALLFAVVLLVTLIFFRDGLFGLFERIVRMVGWPSPFARWARRPRSNGDLPHRKRVVSVAFVPIATARNGESERAREAVTVVAGSPNAALYVDDVSVGFGGIQALSHVSLTVAAGTVHAIIGPNGAGKTTLLNCISGIQRVDEGKITLGDAVLTGGSAQHIRRLGLARTFQHPSLVPDLSVLENVQLGTYGAEPGGVLRDLVGGPLTSERERRSRAAAEAALTLVEFSVERRRVSASELTLGEQKIIDIARALAAKPRVLLMDEPSSGLSEEEIDMVVRVLNSVRTATDLTVCVIAHHVGFIREIAERATVLDFGVVVADGTPPEVTSKPEVIEVFIGASDV